MELMLKMKKYEIICPSCESTFDCSEQLYVWRREFFEDIDKLIREKLDGK